MKIAVLFPGQGSQSQGMQADLAEHLAELGGGRFDRPHQGQFVLNQRMVDDDGLAGHGAPLRSVARNR